MVVAKPTGIYIHIPFCARKCTYCNFNTTDFFEDLAERYVEAVEREIAFWGETLWDDGVFAPAIPLRDTFAAHRPISPTGNQQQLQVDSIYFGGGTPSIIESRQIARIMAACRNSFDVSGEAEITIEINPGAFSKNKIEGWLEAGVNRASVGVQSFADRELASLSRTHTADDSRRTIEALRASGFDNVSLDLIAGLPEQTLPVWESNLSDALALRPEHLSLYLLEVKEGTKLHSQIKRGLTAMPDEDLAAEIYEVLCNQARGAGYEQYEISNFALSPVAGEKRAADFKSKHNLKYWTGSPFYGMGCGAHSYDGRARWSNTLRTESYIEQVELTGRAVAERREPAASELAAEALFMALRLNEGVKLSEFHEAYGVDPLERFGDDLPRLREAGLLDIAEGRLLLTARGRLFSNEVFVSLI